MTPHGTHGIFTIPPFFGGARAANAFSEAPASAPTILAEQDRETPSSPTALPGPPPMPFMSFCAFEGELARSVSLVPSMSRDAKLHSIVTQLRLVAPIPSVFPSLPPRAA